MILCLYVMLQSINIEYDWYFYDSILFCSRLCPSTAGSDPLPESSNFLCHLLSLSIPLYPPPPPPPPPIQDHTISSLQRCFALPTDLTPFTCHSVLLIVHLLSFIWTMCPAHFYCASVVHWTLSLWFFA